MSSLVEISEAHAIAVAVTEDSLSVDLTDGRTIIVPLIWYPRLWHATPTERKRFELIGDGTIVHWDDLDEDLSVSGLLAGRRSGESPESLKRWMQSRKLGYEGTASTTELVDIEGIGPVFAERLSKAGIQTVEALLEQGSSLAGRKALAEKTGISDKLILKWVNHADLFRIKGVAGQYAELLEKAGVDTVVELSKRKAENLFKKMTEVNAQFNLVNKVPEQAHVAKWIEEAKTLPRQTGN